MAGSTPFYGLAFFDFRDRLDLGINIQKEINRFLLIDKQLYGVYRIFGDGVIDGWNIQAINSSTQQSPALRRIGAVANNTISIEISSGNAIINSLAAETLLPEIVTGLPARDTVDIYAVLVGSTVRNRRVRFVWSRSSLTGNAIRIGRVVTSDSSVVSIFQNSPYRQIISFKELIRSEIAKHKHRGSPTKIDLQRETKSQLPGARVADFDADKIAAGRLDPERIPILDHSDLNDTGLLSHAQLDSFVRVIDSGNRELLGEVGRVNEMNLKLTLKYAFADYLNRDANEVDKYDPNALYFIPGISPNKVIDFDVSTAHIDLVSRCVSGKPVRRQGRQLSVAWETDEGFNAAVESNNILVANDQVSLRRDGTTQQVLESFEFPGNTGNPVPGFSSEIVTVAQDIAVTSSDDASDGFQSARFTAEQDNAVRFRYDFLAGQDWSSFDQVFIDVKSTSLAHEEVNVTFVNRAEDGTETESLAVILLGKDEVTQGFETKTFTLDGFTRDNVVAIIFDSPELTGNFEFFVDKIAIERVQLYPPSGFVRLRYSGGTNVQFDSVNYTAQTDNDTSVRVRIRTANSTALLSRAAFSASLNSGDSFILEGTDAEIEVTLYSDESRQYTPILDRVELRFTVDGASQGIVIEDLDDWSRGSLTNMEIDQPSIFSTLLKIEDDINVGNLYFSNNNVISEIDPNNDAVLGVSGNLFPLSPRQALNFAITQGERGFKFPTSVYREIDKNYIVADTDNDRVIEVSGDGEFVRGFGSHNVFDDDVFFPLTAVYNPRTGILTATFSQSVDRSSVALDRFRVWIGGTSTVLNSTQDVVLTDSTVVERVLQIQLSNDMQFALRDRTSDIFLQFLSGAFPIPFGQSTSASRLQTNRGIAVFVGDFTYINGIRHPVFANKVENDNWIVGNSKIERDEDSTEGGGTTGPVQEFSITIPASTNPLIEVGNPGETVADGVIIDWEWELPTELNSITSVTTDGPIWTAEINADSLDEDLIGVYAISVTKIYKDADGVVLQRQSIPISVTIASESAPSGTEQIASTDTVIEMNSLTGDIVFSYDDITFSDFALGSVYEIDEFQFLIAGAGVVATPVSDDGSGGAIGTPIGDPSDTADDTPDDETFEQEAVRKLAQYRGKVVVVDRESGSVNFSYDSPDGLFASDAVLDSSFNYVIAETSFSSNAGRIIKLDPFGNIVFQVGGGVFSKINDVRSLTNGNLIIST